jgi:ABC-type transport system involved in multi-copper enzyme maturation permease subunit
MTLATSPDIRSKSHDPLSFGRAVRAEWTKLRTVRATWTNAALASAMSLVLAIGLAFAAASEWDSLGPDERAAFDPTSAGLVGVLVSGLVMASIAIRSISGEYSTGMIRATLAALPSRHTVLAAKAAVVAALAFPLSLVVNTAGYLAAQQVFARERIQSSLTDPGVVRALLSSALMVTMIAIAGLGLGAAIRHAAGANTVLSLVLIGTQLLGLALPDGTTRFLPGYVLHATISTRPSAEFLPPGAALATFIAYTAIVYEIGTQRLRRGDV